MEKYENEEAARNVKIYPKSQKIKIDNIQENE